MPMPAPLPRRAALLLALATAVPASLAAWPAVARVGPQSFAPLIRAVLPSVVNIAVTEMPAGGDPLATLPPELRRRFADRLQKRNRQAAEPQMSGAGSGFIVDPDGTIVTNNHVIEGASRIVVALADGSTLRARVIGTDDLTDIAVIRVDPPHPLPAISWGDSRALEVGDWVIAAGNPFGLGGSVSAGIVSARGRDLGAGLFDDFIQVDAPINPGNSGGPLFNADGQVVGMTTAIYSPSGGSVGIGFAIPSELLREVIAGLRAHGRMDRGWLGLSAQDVPPERLPGRPLRPGGVGVAAVDRAGPAARAGVRAGDMIAAIDGRPVASARGLIRAVALSPPGRAIHLLLRRNGRSYDIEVTVGRRPNIGEK
ncbi:MAG: trypsin-like peptidase domain-containing protein [Rhodospirillales bacterium]|nr:trypsin-like peptidase domain-containing protein [Rhodospirillales bacterium]MDE2576992.1 trypsin-like peptidase domain-containing protein [Rhodospirillales bacterium]